MPTQGADIGVNNSLHNLDSQKTLQIVCIQLLFISFISLFAAEGLEQWNILAKFSLIQTAICNIPPGHHCQWTIEATHF